MNSFKFNTFCTVIDTWGIPTGNLQAPQMGLFTDCINFKKDSLKGKYCTATLKATKTNQTYLNDTFSMGNVYEKLLNSRKSPFSSGICVPESCSIEQIKTFGSEILKQSQLKFKDVVCYEPPTLKAFDTFAM